MYIAFLLLILTLSNGLFWLVPGGKVAGIVKPADIGLVLVILGFLWSMMQSRVLVRLKDALSISIAVLLFLLAIQASFASFNFNQSILNGLVAIREQYYYLSFFVFLVLLNTEQRITKFLDWCVVLSIFIGILAIADYIFGGFYKHQYAESEVIRSGVVRGQVAGMDIVTLSLLWLMTKFTTRNTSSYLSKYTALGAIFMMGLHFFRQTRSRLVAVMLVLGWITYKSGKKLILGGIVLAFVVVALIAEVTLKDNIILSPFSSVVEVAGDVQGEVPGRVEQISKDLEVFMDNPVIGAGTAALRASQASNSLQASELARKADLGYTHWLKAYGILGMAWLLWFYLLTWSKLGQLQRHNNEVSPLPTFLRGYFYYVVVSFVTLNHFMFGFRIILICAMAAILVNLNVIYRGRQA